MPVHAKGNKHGGRKLDYLQNWLDMTSHENPLLGYSSSCRPHTRKQTQQNASPIFAHHARFTRVNLYAQTAVYAGDIRI